MTARPRWIAWIAATIALVGVAAAAVPYAQAERQDGSLAALTSELRLLRGAVETLTKSQAQTQALGVYLSAQQSRLAQVATRLDAAQNALDTALGRSAQLEAQIAQMSDELPRMSDPEKRTQVQDALRNLAGEQRQVARELQQARQRETELAQAMQIEEGRWSDLITRLEQLIAR